jgi:hypothetical protein
VDKQKIHERFLNGNIYFEESDCEEMPDLNLAGSAVQSYMFELTKGTEGEKSASGSEEYSDSEDERETSHGSDASVKSSFRGSNHYLSLAVTTL